MSESDDMLSPSLRRPINAMHLDLTSCTPLSKFCADGRTEIEQPRGSRRTRSDLDRRSLKPHFDRRKKKIELVSVEIKLNGPRK